MRLLLAEDEKPLSKALTAILERNNYSVDAVYDGEEALEYLDADNYDGVILDIMMPKIDGYHVLQQIRKESNIPVIILSAKDADSEKILGLNLGADDYISKPFSLREVIARVKAVLRRTVTTETERAPERLTYQSLVIDITKKKVSIDDEEVPLTKKEFEILLLLVQNKGRVFSREDILARIWSDEVYVLDRTIDVNITRLRKKIGIYGKRIVTRLGYGYCFEAE